MHPRNLPSLTNQPRPSDSIVKLKVTKRNGETEILNVHRGVLCKNSKFFQSAMKPEWTNLREQPDTIDLPDDSPETVRDYVRWLYSGNLSIKLYKAGKDTVKKKAEKAEKVNVLLAEAYVFGEKIVDIKYKNKVMKTIVAARESAVWNMGPESVNIIYEGTPSESPLRRLIAERLAHEAYDDSELGVGWMQFVDGYPREALMDAIKVMARVRRTVEYDITSVEPYLEKE